MTRDFNSTNLRLKVIPALGREEEEGFSPESINFTWKAINIVNEMSLVL